VPSPNDRGLKEGELFFRIFTRLDPRVPSVAAGLEGLLILGVFAASPGLRGLEPIGAPMAGLGLGDVATS
jgi:hypothetical protein